MSWFSSTFSGSIGRKILVALTGLFLCSFLVIHLIGNFQLFKNDSGEAFNSYSLFMTSNPLIKIISYVLYASILLHVIISILLTLQNKKARPVGYAYSKPEANSAWNSRNMGILGTIILIFIVIHMRTFWFSYHFEALPMFTLENGTVVKDLYAQVVIAFSKWWYTALYVFSMIALGYHLHHGFQSGFQTLGLNHKKYTPFIRQFGLWFSIIVAAGFAIIPLYIYFLH